MDPYPSISSSARPAGRTLVGFGIKVHQVMVHGKCLVSEIEDQHVETVYITRIRIINKL